MKRMLFISNLTNRITNFTLVSVAASRNLGYDFHLAANCSGFNDDASKHNVTIHHIDLERNPFKLKNLHAYIKMLSLIKEEQISVIHCNTPIGGVLGRLCGKKAKVPKIIYTAHGFHFYKGAPLINRTLFKWAEMWMAHYTDAIITMNQEDYIVAQKFNLRNRGKVYYVHGVGVDTREYELEDREKKLLRMSLGLNDEDVVLIAMGDLIKRKNYTTSIKAIAKASNKKLQFLICGKGPELKSLQMLAKELGVDKQVHFLGFRTDIRELLKISDIFLFTSSQEGLPRSMMEAMTARLPCIASKIRGNVDLIEDGIGGYLCNPNDIDGFAEVINILAVNEDLRRAMSLNNLEKIKKFDVENVKLEMKKIYREVLLNGG